MPEMKPRTAVLISSDILLAEFTFYEHTHTHTFAIIHFDRVILFDRTTMKRANRNEPASICELVTRQKAIKLNGLRIHSRFGLLDQ